MSGYGGISSLISGSAVRHGKSVFMQALRDMMREFERPASYVIMDEFRRRPMPLSGSDLIFVDGKIAEEVYDDFDHPGARVAVFADYRDKRDPRNPNPKVSQRTFSVVGGGKVEEFGSRKHAMKHAEALHKRLCRRIDVAKDDEAAEAAAYDAIGREHPSFGMF